MDQQHKDIVPPMHVFVSYAHEDEALRGELEKHLSLLQRQGYIATWHDRQIVPGANWAQEIDHHLGKASLILLLISPDFLASDYCYGVEMKRAMASYGAGTTRVIPILLRPVDWQDAPFASLHCLPHSSRPVTSWSNQDEAWVDIATGIRTVVEELGGFASHKQSRPQSPRNRQGRDILLRRVHAFWIEGVLEQSLHKAALIALGLQEQPDALANPWRLTVQELNRSPRVLPANTHIAQVYDQTDGELLILGEPGAGKTTLLLELARNLLTRAKQDETLPIPVVFNLSSWAEKREPLAKWLVKELHSKYQVQRSLGQTWITEQRILPLLDGLDEVLEGARSACIVAINTYRTQYLGISLVVCSRRTEYFAQEQRFAFLYAVTIQPLTAQQIDTYLTSASGQLEAVRVALRNDSAMQELITTPLLLSVLTLAYQGSSPDALQSTGTSETLQHRLFATYSERMLKRRGSHPRFPEQQTMQWLSWLARQMIQSNQSPFYIERMQRNWLSSRLFRLGHRIIAGLVVGLLFVALFFAVGLYLYINIYNIPDSNLVFELFTLTGLIVGAISGFIGGLQTKIKPAERVLWSWKRAIRGLGYGLLIPLLIWIVVLTLGAPIVGGLIGGLIGERYKEMQPVARVKWKWSWKKAWRGFGSGIISVGLLLEILVFVAPSPTLLGPLYIVLLPVLILVALILGFSGNTVEKNVFIKPNEGIRVSALNGIRYGASTILILGLIAIIGIMLVSMSSDASSVEFPTRLREGLSIVLSPILPFLLFPGLFFGLIVGLSTGGLACIQHMVLRLLLRSTKSIPRNYSQFLDYAAERILLRKVGGGYIFVHQLLLDYFAPLDRASIVHDISMGPK